MAATGPGFALGFVEHGIEGCVEEALDEVARRVVRAGRLAFVAGSDLEFERAGLAENLGVELEEGLVDAAEFVGADVLPADGAAAFGRRRRCRANAGRRAGRRC
jgi:hypothetical protein